MKILVIGSGGREHALVWKISQNKEVTHIFCAPGNAGIPNGVSIQPNDIQGLLEFAKKEKIDLTVVGPELPLMEGITNAFQKEGLSIFGPTKEGAILEFSKCFTKEFCERHHIPTAPFSIFTNPDEAKKYAQTHAYPLVIKADGLAAGKGVIIAKNKDEAFKAIDSIMVEKTFGESGNKIVIEDFMPGLEATYMVLASGEDFLPLESAQDHKRIFDHDEGPNTGGMGAYSPAPIVTDAVRKKIHEEIIIPTLKGLKKEGRSYTGLLYAGLMIENEKPRLVEFNCRFGDPEAQAILFRLKTDLVSLMMSAINGSLKNQKIDFDPKPSVCVVMAAHGYPGAFEKGKKISGLDQKFDEDVFVFHAGTKKTGDDIVTNGGRVLGVTAKDKNLEMAIKKVYKAVSQITWDGVFYRTDIGKKGIL